MRIPLISIWIPTTGLLAIGLAAGADDGQARNRALEHFGQSTAATTSPPASGAPSDEGRGSWSADSLVSVLSGEEVDDTAVASRRSRSADLEVLFEFDSAEISARNRGDLDAVGEALQSPKLEGARFMVAGHTDDVGDPAYNKDLSLRRAQAAKAYLMDTYEIDAGRLEVEGFGAEKPIDEGSDAAARAKNRRVTIEAIQ